MRNSKNDVKALDDKLTGYMHAAVVVRLQGHSNSKQHQLSLSSRQQQRMLM